MPRGALVQPLSDGCSWPSGAFWGLESGELLTDCCGPSTLESEQGTNVLFQSTGGPSAPRPNPCTMQANHGQTHPRPNPTTAQIHIHQHQPRRHLYARASLYTTKPTHGTTHLTRPSHINSPKLPVPRAILISWWMSWPTWRGASWRQRPSAREGEAGWRSACKHSRR